MSTGVNVFRMLLAIGWLIIFVVTVKAVAQMGAAPALTVFLEDFSHPWRAQFYSDLTIHLLLVAAWILYRSSSLPVGIVCALLAANGGGLFTLAYLLVVITKSNGDMRKVLLGRHA